MIQHCLAENSEFGVVLIKSGTEVGGSAEPYPVGTIARIDEIQRMGKGQTIISATGQIRFRLLHITQNQPYLEGHLELIFDKDDFLVSKETSQMAQLAITRYVRLMEGLKGGWVRNLVTPCNPATLSYLIGDILQISLTRKQELLEETSVSKRLEAQLDLIAQETCELKKKVANEFLVRRTNNN